MGSLALTVATGLAGQTGSGGGSGGGAGSDGTPSASLTITLTATGAEAGTGACNGTPLAPVWYVDGEWTTSDLTVQPA